VALLLIMPPLLLSSALFLAELPESEDKYARIMKRPQILSIIVLLGFAMATRDALGDEIPAWFQARLASSDFCAVCEVVHSDTGFEGKEWKIVRLYRGNQAILDKTPALKSSARLLILFSNVGNRSLLIACRSRVPDQIFEDRKRMPLLNRRTPSNPDGSLTPPILIPGRDIGITSCSKHPVQNGAVNVRIHEHATGFDVPEARVTLGRIAALFQNPHRSRRSDSTERSRRPIAASRFLPHDQTSPHP
jgi:hypothetical protein